jgi:hypothetical protein
MGFLLFLLVPIGWVDCRWRRQVRRVCSAGRKRGDLQRMLHRRGQGRSVSGHKVTSNYIDETIQKNQQFEFGYISSKIYKIKY